MNLSEQIKITPLLDTLRLEKIDDKVYFSEKYADYISNSRLGFINPEQDGSPQKFLDGFAGNKIFSDSLGLGSMVHEGILQPDFFEIAPDLNRPTAKVGFIADELIKYGKDYTEEQFLLACKEVDYYKGNPSQKKRDEIEPLIKEYLDRYHNYDWNKELEYTPMLDSKTREKGLACIEALKNNKKVQSLLHPTGLIEDPISECEQAILLDVKVEAPDLPKFVVRLKAKLDNYTIDKESGLITVNDVKTIGQTLDKCDNQVQKYHYYREMAIYCYLLTQCARKFYDIERPRVKSNFLWVSTIPTYYTKVTPMTDKLFKQGMNEFKELLRMAAITLYYKDAIKAEEYFNEL